MIKPCTCHPDDKPPQPCVEKYAYSDCVAAAKFREGWDAACDHIAFMLADNTRHVVVADVRALKSIYPNRSAPETTKPEQRQAEAEDGECMHVKTWGVP